MRAAEYIGGGGIFGTSWISALGSSISRATTDGSGIPPMSGTTA